MYNVGIDLGGTKIAAGLVDDNCKIIFKNSIPTRAGRPFIDIVSDMSVLALDVIRRGGASIEQVESIGIGSPGAADRSKGLILYCSSLNFRDVPLSSEIQKNIGLPVFLDNDANCAALAESIAGAAKDSEQSVTVTLGTGIGCGIIIGRKLYGGFNHAAGEAGHMVIDRDGEQCSCGRKGCWENYASGTALVRQTRKAAADVPLSLINRLSSGDISRIDGKTAFDAARRGDEAAVRVVNQYIRYVSEGLINLINILMPEVVVIGGGVSHQGKYFLKPLQQLVSAGVYGGSNLPQPKLKAAELGNDAGIIGAAMLKSQASR
ncbi:MAG TPA: ROK family protein [Clostridiaceae bacterium]